MDRAPEYCADPARFEASSNSGPEMPRQFLQILETALYRFQPEDRFQTARDMHLALERFLAAMTHYAGQAALTQYIKDLVDGRVEHPEQNSGDLVEPAGDPMRRPVAQRPTRASMDEAQKYEEVFGVTMASKRPRATLRAVPKSWDIKPPPTAPTIPEQFGTDRRSMSPPPPGPPLANHSAGIEQADDPFGASGLLDRGPMAGASLRQDVAPILLGEPSAAMPRASGDLVDSHLRPGQGRMLDLADGGLSDDKVELDLPAQPSVVQRPAPLQRPKPARSGGPSMRAVIAVILLAAAAGTAYAMRDQLRPLAERWLQPNRDSGTPAMSSAYQIASSPAGAQVFLDGERQPGTTPVTVDLIPGVEYLVEVRRTGRATMQRILTAEVHQGPARLDFALEKAGTLRVRTVPPGATVTVDGREAPGRVTPVTLNDVPAGRPVRVRVQVKGLPAQERSVTIPPGKIRMLNVEL